MPVVTTNAPAQTFEEFLTNAGFPTYPCDCRRPAPDMIYDKAWPHRQCKGCRGFLGPARVMAIDTTDKPSRDTPNKAWPFAGMDDGVRKWWDERYIDAGNNAVAQKARNAWAKSLLDAAHRPATYLMNCCGCGKSELIAASAYENGDTGWYSDDPDTGEGVCGGSPRCLP